MLSALLSTTWKYRVTDHLDRGRFRRCIVRICNAIHSTISVQGNDCLEGIVEDARSKVQRVPNPETHPVIFEDDGEEEELGEVQC